MIILQARMTTQDSKYPKGRERYVAILYMKLWCSLLVYTYNSGPFVLNGGPFIKKVGPFIQNSGPFISK